MRSISGDVPAHDGIRLPSELPEKAVKALALFVSEQRQAFPTIPASYKHVFAPTRVDSKHHRFRVDCASAVPQSMVKVIRGRVVDGKWVDEQVIWSVHDDYYTVVPDAVAGGRLGFDKQGHLFGSLKALTVFRLRFRDGELVENEKLVTGLGRVRDIEMGSDGLVYIAIEHEGAGSIVRLVPEE